MRIRRRRQRLSYAVLLLTIFVAAMVTCWYLCVNTIDIVAPANDTTSDAINSEDDGSPGDVNVSDIDTTALQDLVNDWAKSARGEKGVIVYDLDNNVPLAKYNSDKMFNTASLYKLFVVYEGYRRISSDKWSEADKVGNTGYTVLECLDLSIRESHSPCAEGLWAKIGHDKLRKIVEDVFEIETADVESLSSDAEGILGIMKLFYAHDEISDSYIDRMMDSFLNQPATEYDWRQGLPAGFTRAKVYNKVGWDYNDEGKIWNTYNDAAIVEIPESNRHFAVVVMTSSSQYQDIKKLGSSLENIFYQAVN